MKVDHLYSASTPYDCFTQMTCGQFCFEHFGRTFLMLPKFLQVKSDPLVTSS